MTSSISRVSARSILMVPFKQFLRLSDCISPQKTYQCQCSNYKSLDTYCMLYLQNESWTILNSPTFVFRLFWGWLKLLVILINVKSLIVRTLRSISEAPGDVFTETAYPNGPNAETSHRPASPRSQSGNTNASDHGAHYGAQLHPPGPDGVLPPRATRPGK